MIKYKHKGRVITKDSEVKHGKTIELPSSARTRSMGVTILSATFGLWKNDYYLKDQKWGRFKDVTQMVRDMYKAGVRKFLS